MLSRCIIWLFITGLPGVSGCSADSPGATVDKFYTVYLKLGTSGLPSRDEEKAMAPYLSERLLHLIDQARLCQEDFGRRHPHDKPPWAEGCLFASLFEGPRHFKIKNVITNSDGSSTVKVRFRFETYEWEDLVIVRRIANRYVIDDFVMQGAGDFNPPWRFSEGLRCSGE